MKKLNWQNALFMESKNYVCGYCGNPLASEKGYFADYFQDSRNTGKRAYLYICHHCYNPTFFDVDFTNQTPGAIYGNSVYDISDENVKKLYEEARRSFSQNAFTSVVLSCRKLLMHIAVNKGAPAGQNFIQYVEYLSDKNYITPDSKDWVDHIRKKGNEANHEIKIMTKEDAEDLLSFSEMLLKLIYEFPANIKKKTNPHSVT